jgi:precorrin-3B methylase
VVILVLPKLLAPIISPIFPLSKPPPSTSSSESTPVGIVTSASREQENCVISDLEHFTEEEIGMFSIVIIGNSHTYVNDGYMITPRGYKV